MPPVRRRPGATSPIALPVDVEQVRTPATAPAIAAATAEDAAPPRTPEARPRAAGNVVEPATAPAPDPKKSVTVQVRTSLVLQAQTAVLRTAGLLGGPRSFAAFVESAFTHELARLAEDFNEGEPFEVLAGQFRTGRPFGS